MTRRNSMARTVVIDQDECISCGACVDSCPDVFRLNDDNIAEVYNQDGASEEEIEDAIDSCPVTCISWEE
jgi:ferredoxin